MTDQTKKLHAAATKAGIVDLDALRMVDTSNVENPKAFIAQLKQAKPYLFAKDVRILQPAEYQEVRRSILQRARDAVFGPRAPVKDVKQMTAQEYEAEKGRIGLRHDPYRR
jgi:hypothetical protein